MFENADALRELATRLGHRFDRLELLRDAVTHRSFANERPQLAPCDNERLEFLGDAVASLVASTMLWERFPDAHEGELTRRRSDLVCEASLAAMARLVDLGSALRLGNGEERSGGRTKPRLLASALEACLAAVYLDAGIEAASEVARRLFQEFVDHDAPGAHDYKSRVQELVQARGGAAPTYTLVRSVGPDHDRRFFVEIRFADRVQGRGEGRSKVEAEQNAAEEALRGLSGHDSEL